MTYDMLHLICYAVTFGFLYTDGSKTLHTLLVKHYSDLLDRQNSEGAGMKSYSSVLEKIFLYTLGLYLYANFQEKIFLEISGKKFQTFHCSNVTRYNEKFRTFSQTFQGRFFS